MWAQLKHPRHLEFYQELHESQIKHGHDWLLMCKAIQYLQSQSYADDLYAFENILNDGDGGMTLRQLISLILLDQGNAYNERQKKQCFTKILTQQQMNDSAKSGTTT